MKFLSKMVNFRTTPERYEQLKKLAEAMPWPKTVAHLINHGLALAEEQIAGRIQAAAPQTSENKQCVGKKSTRPASNGSKTRSRPTKRKT